ncbi:MAG TPA: hypothetical protein VMV18_10425 [bacterium]|nr:hypothetical protein [bacterium]
MIRRILAALSFALVALPLGARAQTLDIESARAQAMGGAFRALGFDNSAIEMNPAGLGQFKKVEIEPGYYRTQDAREYAMDISISDSITNAAGTGFAFEYRKVKPDPLGNGGFQSTRYVLATGIPVIPDSAWIGLNWKYYKVDYTDATLKDAKGYTSGFGVLYRPIQIVALGFSFDNLINGNQKEAPRSLTGGAAVLPAEWFAASFDVFSDLASTNQEKTGWAGGVQLSPTHAVALRGGLYKEALTGKQVWTGGIGFIADNATIDYAMRIPDGGTKIVSHFVTVSILVF